jgi:hypothetical protein
MLLAAPSAAAEASGRDVPDSGGFLDTGTVTVRGRLTGEGVECQALRTDDNQLFTILGDLRGFQAGDRVTVQGKRVRASACMQGVTVRIKRIEGVAQPAAKH